MALPSINLDDRTFEQLFQEARRRIAVYTPEWTDHNESDPGIVLLQLFAWLEEMILWRLNRVPDKSFVKFLDLIGLQPDPPAAAKAELTFKLTRKDLDRPVRILKGARVTLADAGDGPPVVFETDDNLSAVGAGIKALQSYDGARYTLMTEAARIAGEAFAPLGTIPQKDAALYIGLDRPIPASEFDYQMLIHVAPAPTEARSVTASDRLNSLLSPPPPVDGRWEYWAADGWKPVTVDEDGTRALTRTGVVKFRAPVGHVARTLGALRNGDPLYWLRFRVAEVLGAGYETTPFLEDVLLNTIGATNAVTVQTEILGASTGLPDQTFRLRNTPVLPLDEGVLGRVQVNEVDLDQGEAWETWTEVADFDASGRLDKHYTLNLGTGVVTFGDGEHGKIPRWLPKNGFNNPVGDDRNVRIRGYRYGGGTRGNAGAGKITALQSALPYVDSVTNLRPSAGGRDEDTLEQMQAKAPMVLRTSNRAVTPEDFEFLAVTTPGAQIRRAKALPLFRPGFKLRRVAPGVAVSEAPIPGVVTVLVVPESTLPKPRPSEGTLQLVADWLNGRRLLTAEVYVSEPRYRQVHVKASVIADPQANSGLIEAALKAKLLAYFHPLTGGAAGAGWDFGGTILFSETYRQILSTEGVRGIKTESVRTYLDEAEQASCTDIELEPDELVYSVSHEIEVQYE